MWPLMFLLIGFSLVITLYFGGLRVIRGEISIGMLTAFFGYLVMLIWPMIAFGWVVNILQQGSASMSRLGKILDQEPEIRDTPATQPSITSIEGSIEFKNVVFQHKNTNRPSLDGINLTIQAGTTLAIVGYILGGLILLVALSVLVGWKLPLIQNEQQALITIAILVSLKFVNAITHYFLARLYPFEH